MAFPVPPEAPTFHPSVDEWKDPFAYLAFVRRQAETTGIAKVVPPKSWEPPFAIDKERLRLPTRLQSVHLLQSRDTSAAVKHFWESYNSFLESTGVKTKKKPTIAGQEIDFYQLYKLVSKRGGGQAVTEEKGWRDIVATLQIPDRGGTAAGSCKMCYQRHLQAYEDHCRAQNDEGAGLLAAAFDADLPQHPSDAMDADDDLIDDDEAAEILEAMLGLAPALEAAEPRNKKKKQAKTSENGMKIPDNIFTMVCEQCKGGHCEEKIILCDRCDKGWHMFCLAPPLESVPEDDWVCPSCISLEYESDITRRGEPHTIEDFERVSASFERQWFGSEGAAAAADIYRRELEFWRVVEGGEDVAEVLCAIDVDTTKIASGFPRLDDSTTPYSDNPWNLNKVPHEGEAEYANLIAYLSNQQHVPGVTAPTLSVGMLFTSFGWQLAPQQLYSLDYSHGGAPRKWYAVPSHAAALFESAYRNSLPQEVANNPDLLFKISSVLSPKSLAAAGIPVLSVIQEPGSFVVTFPNVYHFGVNLGVSVTEKVAVGPPDWLRYGSLSVSRYRHFQRPPAFSQERLTVNAAQQCADNNEDSAMQDAGITLPGPPSTRSCYFLSLEMRRIADEERVMRGKLWTEGLIKSRRVTSPVGMEDDQLASGTLPSTCPDPACVTCHAPLYLSAVECDCCPHRRACLHHAANMCECPMKQRRLVWRHSLRDLDNFSAAVSDRITPEVAENVRKEEEEMEKAMNVAMNECVLKATAGVAAAEVRKKEEEMEEEAAKAGIPRYEWLDSAALPSAALPSVIDHGLSGEEMHRKNRLRAASPTPGSAEASSLTLVVGNGFIQRPVNPFATLDVYPEDREATAEWYSNMQSACTTWQHRAHAALQQGGALAHDLPDLVEAAEQFSWGGVSPEDEAAVAALRPKLADAEDYMAAVNAALRGKPHIEAIEALLSQEPKPLVNPPGLDTLRENIQAAREWTAKNAHLGAPDAPPVDVRVLEAAVNDAARLPIALPEAKSLRDRLNTARKVGEAIRSALPSAREAGRRKNADGALTVEYLQHLVAQAGVAKVDMPEAANLQATVEKISAWQQKAAELLVDGLRPAIADVSALLEEAESLPAAMPEVEELHMMVEQAEEWLQQTQNIMQTRPALKRMRDLAHAGLHLPVEVPEVEELRKEIRKREWEDAAKRATNTKGTLPALMEALNNAIEMGAEDSPIAIALQAKVEAAAAWEKRAGQFQARFNQEGGCPEEERPEIEELAQLVNDGIATEVKMERLTTLSTSLTQSNKWLMRAKDCLPAAFKPKEIEEEETADQQQQPKKRPPGRPPSAHLAPGSRLPNYDTLNLLLEEYENKLIIKTHIAEGLRKAKGAADTWLEEARPVLEQDYVVDEQLPLLNVLIEKGKATGVAMDQVDILEANVEALHWAQTVRKIMQQLPPLPKSAMTVEEGEGTGPTDGDAVDRSNDVKMEEEEAKPAMDGVKEEEKPKIDQEPSPSRIAARDKDEEGDEALQNPEVAPATTNGLPPPDPEPSDNEDDNRPIPTLPLDQRPSLTKLMELLEEGSILPCDEKLFEEFKRYVEAGQEWERKARVALSVNSSGGPAQLIGVRKLKKLIKSGERLALNMGALPRLHEVLRAHEKWEQRVRDLMASAGKRPPFNELQVFQQTARLSPVTSNLRRHIDGTVQSIEFWREHCRRAIAKRNTGMRLDRCFEIVAQSIDNAVEQFERRLETEKESYNANGPPRRPGPGPNGEQENDMELYCLCQQTYSADTSMISCDLCGEWYHMRCVGLSQQQARVLRKYSCPICAAVRNHMDPLEYSLGKLRKTRRPTRDELWELLQRVKRLPVMVDEESLLDRTLVKYDRWATATSRAVEVHEASQKKDSVGQVMPLSDGMLYQLLKSALALEVDGTDHAEKILHLLRCNRWRTRVEQVMNSASKAQGGAGKNEPAIPTATMLFNGMPTIVPLPGANALQSNQKASAEAIAKLLLEADRLKIDAKNDTAGLKLLEAAENARQWQENVKACINDLKAAGTADNPAFTEACERAKELVKVGENLPIRVEKELEKLQEYAKPYCLCRKAYDEQKPMLECDNCSEWYHFECVGLPGANGPSGPAPVVPHQYNCPVCCVRTGHKYPYFHRLPQASLDVLKDMAENLPAVPDGSNPPEKRAKKANEASANQPQQQAAAAGMAAAAAQMAMYQQQQYIAQMAQRGIAVTPEMMQQMMAAQAQMAAGGMMHPMYGFMHPAMAAQMAAAQQQAALAQQQKQAMQGNKEGDGGADKKEEEATRPAKRSKKEDGGKAVPAGEQEEGDGGEELPATAIDDASTAKNKKTSASRRRRGGKKK